VSGGVCGCPALVRPLGNWREHTSPMTSRRLDAIEDVAGSRKKALRAAVVTCSTGCCRLQRQGTSQPDREAKLLPPLDRKGEPGSRLLDAVLEERDETVVLGLDRLYLDLLRILRKGRWGLARGQDQGLIQCRPCERERPCCAGGARRFHSTVQLGGRLDEAPGPEKRASDERWRHRLVQRPTARTSSDGSPLRGACHTLPVPTVQLHPRIDEICLQQLVADAVALQGLTCRRQLAGGTRRVPLPEPGASADRQAESGNTHGTNGSTQPDDLGGDPSGISRGSDDGCSHRLDEEGVRLRVAVSCLDGDRSRLAHDPLRVSRHPDSHESAERRASPLRPHGLRRRPRPDIDRTLDRVLATEPRS